MKINTILQTKDGRIIGNAIVIKSEGSENEIKTDYGNTCVLSDKEIIDLFYIREENEQDEAFTHKNRID